MNPWNIVSRKNTLYFHPRAQFPLSNALTVVNCAMAEEEKMEWREGKRVSEILGLSEEWPR